MNIIGFNIDEEPSKIKELLSSDAIDVRKIMAYGKDNRYLLVIYKTKEEQQAHETKRLEQVKEVAKSIRTDEMYSKLKNVNQRCLYLLDKYEIQKSIALDVIDEELVQKLTLMSASASALPEQNPET